LSVRVRVELDFLGRHLTVALDRTQEEETPPAVDNTGGDFGVADGGDTCGCEPVPPFGFHVTR
jgi:hypothetical protein